MTMADLPVRLLLLSRRLSYALLLVVFGVSGLHAQPPALPPAATPPAHEAGSLAALPPLGWASWNHFFCDYTEATIRAQADALVSTGMRDAGYKYVLIQECIARGRTSSGELIADQARFPSGMPALIRYIHRLGLKAGIYTDIGEHTCFPDPHYQGSFGHEEQDARTFAAWGVDLVEMDYCNRVPGHTGRSEYERMAAALRATGRPMLFYLCCWGNEQPWEWAQGIAQMWRTDYDISLEKNHVEWRRLVGNFLSNTAHAVFSGPGSWNDADMLEIGNVGLTDTEAAAQFSMWAMSPSPLLAGADLTTMSSRTRAIYTNREVLALDQDPLGAGAELVHAVTADASVWVRALGSHTGDSVAVMLLNAGDHPLAMTLRSDEIGFLPGAVARDLWTGHMTRFSNSFRALVSAHSATLLHIQGHRSWIRPIRLQAESPVNARLGETALLSCGECSDGYALRLGGGLPQQMGEVRFQHITSTRTGPVLLHVRYVRNGLEDQMLSVAVNGDEPISVRAIMRSWNEITLPITLKAGENTIALRYGGKLPLDLDCIALSRPVDTYSRDTPPYRQTSRY